MIEADQTAPEKMVERQIEHEIIFGLLQPGERLREHSLTARFGASRHHVRQAIQNLERAGIVAREPNKSARVTEFGDEEVRQLYDTREMLTRQAALRIALPVADDDRRPIATAQAAHEAAVEADDLPAIHEANDRFHMALFRLCGNPYLERFLKECMNMTYVIRAANMTDRVRLIQAREEHRTILSMLQGTDTWALAELCVQHLRPSRDAYLNRLKGRETGRRHTPPRRGARS